MFIEVRVPLVGSYDSDADAAYIYFDHPVPAGAAEKVALLRSMIGAGE